MCVGRATHQPNSNGGENIACSETKMVVSPSLVPTQQADVSKKKCHVSFFVELTDKLNNRD
jgi:hypothetical protein